MSIEALHTPGLLRSAVVAIAFLTATSIASAQWWNPMQRPAQPYEAPKPITYTAKTRNDAYMAANAAILNEDWAKLDRMYDEFLAQDLRANDGLYMVEAIQRLFADRYGVLEPARADKDFAAWELAQPNSKLRPAARVVMLQAQGWAARGGRLAGAVPGESMQIFREKMIAATRALAETENVGRDSPIWWWAALIVAGSTARPAGEFDAMFSEATRRFPSYQPLYYTRVNYLLPQWGGDWDRVDAFVDRAVQATVAKEGDAMYAWIYVDLSVKTRDLFGDTRVEWPRLRKAFEDMVQRYPADENRNLFATFACRARDKETTAKLLAELGTRAQLGAFSSGITTESCRRFALTAA